MHAVAHVRNVHPRLVVALVAAVAWAGCSLPQESAGPTPEDPPTLALSSPAFAADAPIPVRFTCDGENVSPPLAWEGVPEATQALAFVMDDPDAPTGTFTHWMWWNLPPDVESLPVSANVSLYGGIEGQNDAGSVGYTGPCPPTGTHTYVFRLYALGTPLDLQPGARPGDVRAALAGAEVLTWGEMMATYTRN